MDWISVKQKLPPHNLGQTKSIRVLCACVIDSTFEHKMLYYHYPTKEWYLDFHDKIKWNVTHWMYLPEFPDRCLLGKVI